MLHKGQFREFLKKALEILSENIEKLHDMAHFLLKKETISGAEFMEILES